MHDIKPCSPDFIAPRCGLAVHGIDVHDSKHSVGRFTAVLLNCVLYGALLCGLSVTSHACSVLVDMTKTAGDFRAAACCFVMLCCLVLCAVCFLVGSDAPRNTLRFTCSVLVA